MAEQSQQRPDHDRSPERVTPGLNDADLATRQSLEESYTRDAHNEIQQLFPRLPNPDMVIYIYPHMAGNEPAPVPGYSSVFSFYSRVQYALPGERLEAL